MRWELPTRNSRLQFLILNKIIGMKKLIVFFSLLCLLSCINMDAQVELLPAVFESRINLGKAQLLDVRTAGEYQSGHLKNSLQADWQNKEQFLERIKYLDKSKPLLVYCASGMRSASAAKWLLDNGFKEVQNLKGGLTAWKMDSKPIETASNKPQLDISTYYQLTTSADIVLIDFGAEWCPPCKKMEPLLKKLQEQLKDQFTLIKVDGGMDIDVMKKLQVAAIPTFIVYKKGKEVWRKQGVVEFSELEKQLSK